MDREQIYREIKSKNSFLCIGLDTDLNRIPECLQDFDDPVLEFNKAIIEATSDLCVAYKPNLAFYEAMGPKGWTSLEKTLDCIPDNIFTIADAKRGDIGNTSGLYARAFFEYFDFDAVTVAPYMGEDSVAPFLEFDDKWVILLGLTSNRGSQDFQHFESEGEKLYEKVIKQSQRWGNPDNMMYVIGATHPEKFKEIRSIAPEHFFLVPGVGAQGGSVGDVATHGLNNQCGLLINSSRGIIYAGDGEDFADKARESALKLTGEMSPFI